MKRYWYHISSKLERKGIFTLKPWGDNLATNRPPDEPTGDRIPVAPSISQCLVAIPLYRGEVINVYRTETKVTAEQSDSIFDAEITEEHWLTKPTKFKYIGKLNLADIDDLNYTIDYEVCCYNDVKHSQSMLNKWKSIKPQKYLKK